MGWKAATIIIQDATPANNEEILTTLGFDNLQFTGDEPFETAMDPEEDKVYIGSCKGNLLICAQELSMQFFDEEETAAVRTLTQLFPRTEICSIILQSTVNLWGYSIIKNTQKIRTRAGSADEGTFLEYGEPLEEEKELLSRSTIGEDGNRIYILHDQPGEPYQEDQVGENLVFAITRRYFGEELDSDDELLFETTLAGYHFGKPADIPASTPPPVQQETVAGKPWWKFW